MNWFQQLTQKLVWAHRVIITDSAKPMLRLDNGITIDLNTSTIILEGDCGLHIKGNFTLSADGEVTIRDRNSQLTGDDAIQVEIENDNASGSRISE